MTWNQSWPEGNKSVKDNRPRGNNNMQYIQAKMRLDHFWDEDATKDGYHKQVDMPNLAVDPVALPSVGVNGQIYVRQKTVAQAPDAQISEPFFASVNGASLLYNQLGFRALVHFQGRSSNGLCTLKYNHNFTSVNRTAEGRYTFTFAQAMPSANYIVLGSGIRNSSSTENTGLLSMIAAQSKASVMTDLLFNMLFTRNTENDLEDPLFGWVAVIGG